MIERPRYELHDVDGALLAFLVCPEPFVGLPEVIVWNGAAYKWVPNHPDARHGVDGLYFRARQTWIVPAGGGFAFARPERTES